MAPLTGVTGSADTVKYSAEAFFISNGVEVSARLSDCRHPMTNSTVNNTGINFLIILIF
jgi:hypothetical protein